MDVARINKVCIGWSSQGHYDFFKNIISNDDVKNICICGVYFGRDIAYMRSIIKELGKENVKITGVDLFSPEPGTDWEEEKKNLTWEQFCGMPSPTMEKAKNNLIELGLFENVELIQSKDSDFLKNTTEKFDFIYLDTAHDYQTVKTGIDLSIKCMSENGYIGGDDFCDSNTWGVASAVNDSFESYKQHGVCWISDFSKYKA